MSRQRPPSVRLPYYLPERFRDLVPARTPIAEADPKVRARTDEEVLGSFDPLQAIYEAQRCLYCHEPSCVTACPLGQDCREYILEISRGNFEQAKAIILRDNPLASTLARVCYHYCEASCVCGVRGDPIAIRHLKRAALEFGGADIPYSRGRRRTGSVGIVGGGPAGLMAAWWLARLGFPVRVYEASDHLGGLATMTIPHYRLPRAAFQTDLDRMRELGIEFLFGMRLGQNLSLESLRASHDAVLLAIGTHAPTLPRIPGLDLPGVLSALDFLKQVHRGSGEPVGERVAVIGGGDVAMDCARVALRRGAREVTIVYRRSREEMPASAEEVHETMDENVRFLFLTSPVRFLGTGRVETLECQSMVLGEPDASGRRRPVAVEGSNYPLAVDTVILALGQNADLKDLGLERLGVATDSEGVAIGVDGGPRTTLPDVFVAGGSSVVAAMKAGREAAIEIERILAAPPREVAAPTAPSEIAAASP